MNQVQLPVKNIPVADEVDLLVAGGSCTGVFAAITAARLGARVAIIEAQNRFGGTATAGQVCLWHSFFSQDYSKQIIFGLNQEFVGRMQKRGLVTFWKKPNPDFYVNLNTEEMCCELDEMVLEAGVIPYLHTRLADVWRNDAGRLAGVVIAGKDGLSVIKANYFLDATGDGDLVAYAGGKMWYNEVLQTATACMKLGRWDRSLMDEWRLGKLVHAAKEKYRMPEGVIWGTDCCDSPTYMLAGTNVPEFNSASQKALTAGEMESRRQMRAILDIVAEAGYPRPVMEAIPSLIGVRESRHITSLHRITADELLSGCRFPDEAGKGTYRSDVHRRNPAGTIFRYLDGRQMELTGTGAKWSRWRDESLPTPEYYTWPLRSQVPVGFDNIITAGRMIDAEAGAYGALRVMVNMNQSGEAAGRAAAAAIQSGKTIPQVVNEMVEKAK